jgi:RHS repeat-associated protein
LTRPCFVANLDRRTDLRPLTSDGTYNYEYDAEGNRQRRVEIATSAVTDYQWDHRNRLTSVRNSTSNTVTENWGTREASMSATYYTSATVRPAPEGSAIIVSIVSTSPSLTYTLVNRSATSGFDYAVDPNYANGQIEVPPWQTAELRLPTFANTSGESTESFEIQISDGSGQIILEAEIFDLTLTQSVDYKYDAFNQLIRRTLDTDGAGSGAPTDTFFSHENGQINLQFDGSAAGDLTNRYLWGPNVDQLLADETVTSLTSAGNVQWPLADHPGTIRDIADRNESTGVTTVTNHRRYDSFGILESETNAAVDMLFGYTGRALDEATGLQNNLNRWYDASTGQWMSEDPIGFEGDPSNLYRYVGNTPTMYGDPSGLIPLESITGAIRGCNQLPTAAARVECLKHLMADPANSSQFCQDRLKDALSLAEKLMKHMDDLKNAVEQYKKLQQALYQAKNAKERADIMKQMDILLKGPQCIQGHIKEITHKWPTTNTIRDELLKAPKDVQRVIDKFCK